MNGKEEIKKDWSKYFYTLQLRIFKFCSFLDQLKQYSTSKPDLILQGPSSFRG